MMHKTRLLWKAGVIATVLALVMVGVAYAITIVVDGTKEAAWDGSGGQTPGIQSDGNESGIDNRYDIKEVRWTNDAIVGAPYGHMYLLIESFSNLNVNFPALPPTVIFCLNVDNNTGSGVTISGYCNDIAGADRKIEANLLDQTVTVRRWNGSSWVIVSQPAGGMRAVSYNDPGADGIADLPYIEIGVDLESLGITNSSTCLSIIPTAIYYDNGMADLEDVVPESGTFSMGCGTPTAITLSSLEAKSQTDNTASVALLAVAVLGLGTLGIMTIRRRRTHSL